MALWQVYKYKERYRFLFQGCTEMHLIIIPGAKQNDFLCLMRQIKVYVSLCYSSEVNQMPVQKGQEQKAEGKPQEF